MPQAVRMPTNHANISSPLTCTADIKKPVSGCVALTNRDAIQDRGKGSSGFEQGRQLHVATFPGSFSGVSPTRSLNGGSWRISWVSPTASVPWAPTLEDICAEIKETFCGNCASSASRADDQCPTNAPATTHTSAVAGPRAAGMARRAPTNRLELSKRAIVDCSNSNHRSQQQGVVVKT